MKIEYIDGHIMKKMILSGAQYLEINKQIVNSLNVFPVPDGDTGTNMSLTMQSAAKEVRGTNTDLIEDIANSIANGSLMGARGNSGVILSQLFRGFAQNVKGKTQINTMDIAQALKSGADTAYKAVMKPIEGTILTVARESAEAALIIAERERDVIIFLEKVIEYAEKSLSRTPDLLKVLKEANVVDSGGKGLVYIYSGALAALKGNMPEVEDTVEKDHVHTPEEINENEIKFGYCTEFIINSNNTDINKFKENIEKYGDSMLVVGNDSIVKVHIHTNHPGEVIEHALKLGDLNDIKIDNMRSQHRHEIFDKSESENNKELTLEASGKQEMKPYGFIAVTIGEGLTEIFKDFNVDHVIEGGQTMNPSTEDFVKAIGNIDAETIIILPNNSNIFMAANQAKDISNKNIIVIPSKTVPQGLSALLSFNAEISPEENETLMTEAITSVKTGQITYAVRDTSYNDLNISEGDILGISDGEIKSTGKNIDTVSIELIDKMITDESEIITIFYGSDTEKEKADELLQRLIDKYEDIDVEMYYGGQPLYYYIFSVE